MAPYADVTSTDFTYTGQRALPDTGLMDYRARFYSPSLKRFIQPDSIIPGAANPQSWNRFAYVTNNPINYSDPSGHMRIQEGEQQDKFIQSEYDSYRPQPGRSGHTGNGKNDSDIDPDDILSDANGYDGKSDPSGSLLDLADFIQQTFNWGGTVSKTIVGSDGYYTDVTGWKAVLRLALVKNNSSPITLTNNGISMTGPGDIALRGAVDTQLSSNYGIVTTHQVNDILRQNLGFSIPTILQPKEFSANFLVSSTWTTSSGDKATATAILSVQGRMNQPQGLIADVAAIPILGSSKGTYFVCKLARVCP